MDDYPKREYVIPYNFALDGKAVKGIAWANLIEAVVIFAALLILDILFMPGIKYRIYGGIVCACPAILALVGVNGLSLTSFFADMLHYKATGTVYAKPTPEAILVRERQIIQEKHRMIEAAKKEKKREEKSEKKAKKKGKHEKNEAALGVDETSLKGTV